MSELKCPKCGRDDFLTCGCVKPPKPKIHYNGRPIDIDNPPFDYRHKKISFVIGFIAFLSGIIMLGLIISGGL